MFRYLPTKIYNIIKKYGFNNVNEIRLRKNSKIKIVYDNKIFTISNYVVSSEDIETTVLNACKRSIYSYDEQIKSGFITTDSGVRIGLAGEFVYKNNIISGIRNFSSLVIRIPKDVTNFASDFYYNKYSNGSVLVASVTGGGKTTFIRDFARLLSKNDRGNIVIIDERNEIAPNIKDNYFDLGENCDVLTYCNKDFGFLQAIRTLNPNYVITDELTTTQDANGVLRAYNSGINVIATVHASNVKNLLEIEFLDKLIINKCFSYIVFIENRKITVYNSGFNEKCLL